ncbi:MAG: hypothetical protein LBU27_03475 [Candidatus Peribacteria bacterium]|nr:hypothetical protein [Candidatus Peribacteria bacterium]
MNTFPKNPPKLTSFGALSSNLSAFWLRGTAGSFLRGIPQPIGGIALGSRVRRSAIDKRIKNKDYELHCNV